MGTISGCEIIIAGFQNVGTCNAVMFLSCIIGVEIRCSKCNGYIFTFSWLKKYYILEGFLLCFPCFSKTNQLNRGFLYASFFVIVCIWKGNIKLYSCFAALSPVFVTFTVIWDWVSPLQSIFASVISSEKVEPSWP